MFDKGIFNFRYKYIAIARELCYPKEVIEKLKHAIYEEECINILRTARLNIPDD